MDNPILCGRKETKQLNFKINMRIFFYNVYNAFTKNNKNKNWGYMICILASKQEVNSLQFPF